MKINMFIATLMLSAAGALSAQTLPAQAETTVITGQAGPTVVIEQDGKKPVIIDENKDIKGMVKVPAQVETTGRAELDSDGNVVRHTKKDCVDESWLGGGKKGDGKCE